MNKTHDWPTIEDLSHASPESVRPVERPADNDLEAWSKFVDSLIKSDDDLAPPTPILVTAEDEPDDGILPEEDPIGLVSIRVGLMRVRR